MAVRHTCLNGPQNTPVHSSEIKDKPTRDLPTPTALRPCVLLRTHCFHSLFAAQRTSSPGHRSADCSVTLVCQGCRLDLWSGHTQEPTAECISGTASQRLSLSPQNQQINCCC